MPECYPEKRLPSKNKILEEDNFTATGTMDVFRCK